MTDRFQAHIGVVVIAVVAVGAVAAVIWQVTHGHSVDPLLAGIATGAIGVLTPTPTSRQSVTVDNPPENPVPVETPPADVPNGGPSLAEKIPLVEPARKVRKRADKGHAAVDLALIIAIVALVVAVLTAVHAW